MSGGLRLLVTGGAGYIGSHVVLAALAAGHAVHVLDDLSSGHREALRRVEALAGRPVGFTRGCVRDAGALAAALAAARPAAAIHLAGLKEVGASFAAPGRYAAVNVGGTEALVAALARTGCRRLVFSSSANVYGAPERLPVGEDHPLAPASPYGATKVAAEAALAAAAGGGWAVAALRYFNPAGAHASGRIGEDPGRASTLVPALVRAAAGREMLTIHGADWATEDGTGLRDYLHVMDLAEAHLAALDWTARAGGFRAFNLGTGRATTVLGLVRAFAAATGRRVPYRLGARRPGDVGACWADPARAAAELGWRARRPLGAICASAWAWDEANPAGYGAPDDCGTQATVAAAAEAG